MNEELIKVLKDYLELPSCDGRPKRQALRKELAAMVDREYSLKTNSTRSRLDA